MIFTDDEISDLIHGRPLARYPHPGGNGLTVEPFLRDAVRAVSAATGTADRTEWNH